MFKNRIIISAISFIFSSCVSNMATRAPFVPLFDKQGEMSVKAAVTPHSVQGDIKVAAMENIAFGINGNYSSKMISDLFSSEQNYNGNLDRSNNFLGTELGYFNHFRNIYFDGFGGWGKGRSKYYDNIDYSGSSTLNSNFEQFSFQLDVAKKNIYITKRNALWIYYAYGLSAYYEYNIVDVDWQISPSTYESKKHFIGENFGLNFFYRVGVQKVQVELAAGFRYPKSDVEYRNISLYSEENVHFSLGFSFLIEALIKKKSKNTD